MWYDFMPKVQIVLFQFHPLSLYMYVCVCVCVVCVVCSRDSCRTNSASASVLSGSRSSFLHYYDDWCFDNAVDCVCVLICRTDEAYTHTHTYTHTSSSSSSGERDNGIFCFTVFVAVPCVVTLRRSGQCFRRNCEALSWQRSLQPLFSVAWCKNTV